MRPEFLDRLVSLGFATYRRTSVGLGSHFNIVPTKGTCIAITNIEVLPWLGLIQSGTFATTDIGGVFDLANPDIHKEISRLYGKSECQLRIWPDEGQTQAYTLRANIKYDGSANAAYSGLDLNTYVGFMRGIEIERQSFDCLVYANQRVQLSMVELALGSNSVALTSNIVFSAYPYDLRRVLGIDSGLSEIDILVDFDTPNQNNYFPTNQSYLDPSVLSGYTTPGQRRNNFMEYPMQSISGESNAPVYSGSIDPVIGGLAELTNLPVLNVEYVEIRSSNRTTGGYLDENIQKVLGWI